MVSCFQWLWNNKNGYYWKKMMSTRRRLFSKQSKVTSCIQGKKLYFVCDCGLRHQSIRILKEFAVFASSQEKYPNQIHRIINWLATALRILWLIRFQISMAMSYIFWRARVRPSSHGFCWMNRQESTADCADMLFALVNLNLLPPVQWLPQLCFKNAKIKNEKLGNIFNTYKMAV